MPSYRLYRFDGAGKIASAEWLEAADDDRATALARRRCKSGQSELWDRDRLVARIERAGR